MSGAGVYFAFPDGAFDYDCIRCGGKCCRGMGIGSDVKRELPRLLRLYPDLAPFASPSVTARRIGDVHNYRPRCWFLDDDLLCRVEKGHGRGAKPAVCKLFPFGHVRWFGSRLVVLPQFDCPMTVTEPGRCASLSDHESLAALLAEYDFTGPQGASRIGPPEVEPVLLETEAALTRLCGAHLAAGEEGWPWAAMLASPASMSVGDAEALIAAHEQWWQALLAPAHLRELTLAERRLLVAMAPGLRMHRYLQWGPVHGAIALAALCFYLRVVTVEPVDAPTVWHLLEGAGAALQVLAKGGTVPQVARPELLVQAAASEGPLAAVAAGLLQGGQDLRTVVEPIVTAEVPERVPLLQTAGELLAMTTLS